MQETVLSSTKKELIIIPNETVVGVSEDENFFILLVKIFDFKQQRPSEGFSIGHVEDERLVEERVLCLAVDHGLT